jgi:hypothetical protein
MPDGAAPQHESRVLPLAQHWERGPGGEGLFTGGTEERVRSIELPDIRASGVEVPGQFINQPAAKLSRRQTSA